MASKEKKVSFYEVAIQQARDEFAEHLEPSCYDAWTRPDVNEDTLGPFTTLDLAIAARTTRLEELLSASLPYEGHVMSVGPRGGRTMIFV